MIKLPTHPHPRPTNAVRYISTRGNAPTLDFEQATLAGLATDGGLYLPDAWQTFSAHEMHAMRELNYAQLTARIIGKFSGNCIPVDTLETLSEQACQNFAHPTIAPLKQLDSSLYLLELFHGPTLAFKDFALQFLGQLFGYFLNQRGQTCTIIGATSGDTGSAAIESVRGLDAVTMYMLHPHGRVSEVQRRQMTTVLARNIHNLAVDGDFDDCQNLVKGMFNDAEFRQRHSLAAVNSINWARIAAQTVYYFYAALQLGAPQRAVNFAVPTGNFGNVFAGYAARKMGLPINRLTIGSNRNDILTRFFDSGRMARSDINATISPSMDIQISSNFERYLFELGGRDSAQVCAWMAQFGAHGTFEVAPEIHRKATELFFAKRFSDEETRAQIKQTYEQTGELLDPHSAIGVAAAHAAIQKFPEDDAPTVALGTAHPAKFADAVFTACGARVALPESLQGILQRTERMQRIDNDAAAVKALIDGARQ